jgi:hypothetical protein
MHRLLRSVALGAALIPATAVAVASAQPDPAQHPHGGPPGQNRPDTDGDGRPDHPHGGPPGQQGRPGTGNGNGNGNAHGQNRPDADGDGRPDHPHGGPPGRQDRPVGRDGGAVVSGDVAIPEREGPAPELGETVTTQPADGRVLIRVPGSDEYVPLTGGAAIPVGSLVDARDGTVALTAESDADGTEQTAVVHGAVFAVEQERAAAPVTELSMRGGDFSDCARPARGGRARTASRRRSGRVVRGLWASGHGRFRTRGRHSAATVRGTRWATVDRCDSTTTRVYDGVVEVRTTDGETVRVEAGDKHVARGARD